jgi:ribonuclease HI
MAKNCWEIPDILEEELTAWLSQQEVSSDTTWLANLTIDLPVNQPRTRFREQGKERAITHIYTDGSLIDGQAGWGFYKREQCEDAINPNGMGRVSGAQEVIRGELRGILEALKSEQPGVDVTVWVDSEASLKTIRLWTSPYSTGVLERKENHDLTTPILKVLYERAENDGHTYFEKIAAHKGNYGNEKADALAKAGAQQPRKYLTIKEGDFLALDEDSQPITGRKGTRKLLAKGYTALNEKAAAHWMLKLPNLPYDSVASNRYMSDKQLKPWSKLKIFKMRHSTYAVQARLARIGIVESPLCLLCKKGPETVTHMLCGCEHGTYQDIRTKRHNRCAKIVAESLSKHFKNTKLAFKMWEDKPIATELIEDWERASIIIASEDYVQRPKPDIVILLPPPERTEANPKYCRGIIHIWELKIASESVCAERQKKAEEKYAGLARYLELVGFTVTVVVTVLTARGYILSTAEKELKTLGLKRHAIRNTISALHIQLINEMENISTYRWKEIKALKPPD